MAEKRQASDTKDFQRIILNYKNKRSHIDEEPTKIPLTINRGRYTKLEVVANTEDPINQKRRTVIKGYDKKEKKTVYIKGTRLTNAKIQKQFYREMMLGYELDYKHIVKVSDNWITIKNQDVEEAFMVSEELGKSIDYLTKPNGKMGKKKKNTTGYSDLRFTDWLQIAHQLIKTLIVLKLNGVIHRDVKTDNILVKFDGNTSKDEIEKLNITLIDFGWARPIAKNDVDMTLNAGTQGKIAPEIILRNAVYKSKITEKPYSFPVDMFSSGITLLEIFKKDLFPNLEAAFNIKQDGNTRKNETAGISLFASMCEEFNYDAEEQRNILNVDKGCQHELGKSQERHFKKYVSKASTNRNLGANKSDALRFILNFWFKNLNPELGWTDEIKEQVGMFCLEMIHYWPDKRPTPEQLIGHDIFNLSDPVTGLKVIETENIERIIQKTVKRSSDTEYEIFMQKMANTQQNYILNFKPEGQIGSGAQGNETMVYSLDPLGSKTTVNIKGLGQIDKNLITGKDKGSEYDLNPQSASFVDLPLNHELVNKSESSVSEREIKFKQKLQENFKEIKNINNDLQSFPTPNRKNDSFTINTYGLGDDGDSNDDGLYEYTDPEMYGEEELTFTDAMYCYGIKSDIWGFGGGAGDDQDNEDILYGDNIYGVVENDDAQRNESSKGMQFNEDDFKNR